MIGEFFCRLRLHDFGGWSATQELPLWKTARPSNAAYAIGYQPTERKLYTSGNGFIEKLVPDLDYKLVGKAIEQRRTCRRCYRTQVRCDKVAV